MAQGDMVLTNGVCVGTWFYLDACTIECNSSLFFAMEISIGYTPSHSKPPKQALSLESKLPI
jgi:hypothetical protein